MALHLQEPYLLLYPAFTFIFSLLCDFIHSCILIQLGINTLNLYMIPTREGFFQSLWWFYKFYNKNSGNIYCIFFCLFHLYLQMASILVLFFISYSHLVEDLLVPPLVVHPFTLCFIYLNYISMDYINFINLSNIH